MKKFMLFLLMPILLMLVGCGAETKGCIADNYITEDYAHDETDSVVIRDVNYILTVSKGASLSPPVRELRVGERAFLSNLSIREIIHSRIILEDGEFVGHESVLVTFDSYAHVQGNLQVTTDEQTGEVSVIMTDMVDYFHNLRLPVLIDDFREPSIVISNPDGIARILEADNENYILFIHNFVLVFDANDDTVRNSAEVSAIFRTSGNYIYAINTSQALAPQKISEGDEFLGMTLESLGRVWLVYNADGEFSHTDFAEVDFAGEMTLSGTLWIFYYPSHGGLISLFYGDDDYYHVFPDIAGSHNRIELVLDIDKVLGSLGMNADEVLEQLQSSGQEFWLSDMKFDVTITIDRISLSRFQRSLWDYANLVELSINP